MSDINLFELAEVVSRMVQDKIDQLKFVDFAEVKATYHLENGGYVAEVLIPGALTTTNPLNCLLGYIPKVGDWAAVLYPRNTAPVLVDATPMRENTVTPPAESFSPFDHNHDGVYAPAYHIHDDRYYTEQEVQDLIAGFALLDHTHSPEAVKIASLLNSFAAAGDPYDPPGYYKDTTKRVCLSGALTGGTLGLSSFQLQVGYRPLKTRIVSGTSHNGTTDVLCRIQINPDGNVIPLSGSTTFISLDGISFRSEQ